jgi:uncharacterized protein YdhG (YjbR/CyaY superfamily)
MPTKKTTSKHNEGEINVVAAINAMNESDKTLAEKIHTIVKENAPMLVARTWYGMPAYANKDGKIVVFFQSKQRFKTRYATLGFMHEAKLDDGNLWPASYALLRIEPNDEKYISELVKKAVS